MTWEQYGAVLAAFLVRKPGAGTLAMCVNGFVQVFIDGTHAPHLLYGVTGVGVDLVFGMFGYRRYDARIVALAGLVSQMSWYPIVYLTHGVVLYPISFIIADLVVRALGSVVGDGLLGAAIGFLLLAGYSRFLASSHKMSSMPS